MVVILLADVLDQVLPPAFGAIFCDSRNRDESLEGTGISCIVRDY